MRAAQQMEMFHTYNDPRKGFCADGAPHRLDFDYCCTNDECDWKEFYPCNDCAEMVQADDVEWSGGDETEPFCFDCHISRREDILYGRSR